MTGGVTDKHSSSDSANLRKEKNYEPLSSACQRLISSPFLLESATLLETVGEIRSELGLRASKTVSFALPA